MPGQQPHDSAASPSNGVASAKSSQQHAAINIETPAVQHDQQHQTPHGPHSSLQRQPSQNGKVAANWPPPSKPSQAEDPNRGPSNDFPASGRKEVKILHSRSGRLSENEKPSNTPSNGSNGHAYSGPNSPPATSDTSKNTPVAKVAMANQTQEVALAPSTAQNITAAVSKPDGATSWPPQPMGVRSHAVPPPHAASHVVPDQATGPKQPLLEAARSASGWSSETNGTKANGKMTDQHDRQMDAAPAKGPTGPPSKLEPEEVKALGEQPSIVPLPSKEPEVEADHDQRHCNLMNDLCQSSQKLQVGEQVSERASNVSCKIWIGIGPVLESSARAVLVFGTSDCNRLGINLDTCEDHQPA